MWLGWIVGRKDRWGHALCLGQTPQPNAHQRLRQRRFRERQVDIADSQGMYTTEDGRIKPRDEAVWVDRGDDGRLTSRAIGVNDVGGYKGTTQSDVV